MARPTDSMAEIYKLKHKIGILLKQGYVRDSTKAKLRMAAMKRPDLFGCFINC